MAYLQHLNFEYFIMQKKIVLIGYMGTGKSSIGKILSYKLTLPFIDLDNYISEKEKLSIPQLFLKKGTLYFRRKEKEYLIELLNSDKRFILSTGGGTPCYYDNMSAINTLSTSIFINTPLKILVERLKINKASRPLISHLDNTELTEFVAKHLFERNKFYHKAKIHITNKDSISTSVTTIIAKLEQFNAL